MEVKAIRTCFVGSYRETGEQFDYDGPMNTNLQPLSGKWPSKAVQAAQALQAAQSKAPQTGLSEPAEPVNR